MSMNVWLSIHERRKPNSGGCVTSVTVSFEDKDRDDHSYEVHGSGKTVLVSTERALEAAGFDVTAHTFGFRR